MQVLTLPRSGESIKLDASEANRVARERMNAFK